jgi:hypothetical protein
MTEQKFKQVCECENCGNEAEMTITCKLIPEEDTTPQKKTAAEKPAEEKIKGHAVCSQCGGEADIWIDDIENLQKI